VLIENQLERTDHTHLGQLLTYASGLEAVTIVWIAERFTEEHRSTLDWLNKITDESFRFFGLEGSGALVIHLPHRNSISSRNRMSGRIRWPKPPALSTMRSCQTREFCNGNTGRRYIQCWT
jgi:hypothetical protein